VRVGCGGFCGVERPVARTGGVGLQQNVGVGQHQSLDVDLLGEQRHQRHLHFEAPDLDHFGARAPRRIAERHVGDAETGIQADGKLDVAFEDQIAPGRLFGSLDDLGFVLVGVDRRDHNEYARHDQHHEARKPDGNPFQDAHCASPQICRIKSGTSS
jgi:hypothetical protein